MDLYEKYHTSRQDERRGLFEIARDEFAVASGLYPGCFVPKSKALPEDRAAARDYLMELGRGVGYVKSAADYVFRKVATLERC